MIKLKLIIETFFIAQNHITFITGQPLMHFQNLLKQFHSDIIDLTVNCINKPSAISVRGTPQSMLHPIKPVT